MKKFFQSNLFILLALCIWGYASGLRPNNYQQFVNKFLDKHSLNKEAVDEKNTADQQTFEPEEDAKDEQLNEVQPLPENPFEDIDRRARECPQKNAATIKALAKYLQRNTETDLEKTRAIYVWITENIRYADDEYNSEKCGDMSAKGVLLRKKAVCGGFSNLFLALGQEMGLNVERVVGYSKDYDYKVGTPLKKADHAWNAVKINGQWRIFDATWGEGNGSTVGGKLVSEKKFDDYWFNVDPYEAIFSHFPENPKFAFIQPALSLKTYERLPHIDGNYFKLGFDGSDTYESLLVNKNTIFPQCYGFDTYVKMRFAPKYKTLFIGESYGFEFYIPQGLSAAIIDADDNWTYFRSEKGQFKVNYAPNTEGSLKFCVNYKDNNYMTVLEYTVKTK
jgi:Transglutaminase-like superfamily